MVRCQASSLTIGKLAGACDVGVETIRYYQRRGLLETPGRDALDRGSRRYGPEDLRRLRFIRSAQASGFTLEQIGNRCASTRRRIVAGRENSLASASHRWTIRSRG